MNRTICLSLALAVTTTTLVGAFFVPPPQAAAQAPELRPLAATGDLICGLSVGDIADIIDHYDFDPDMQALADALSTPFDCGAYGSLCSEIDVADAYEFVCGSWDDMRIGTPVAEIIANIHVRLDEIGVGTCNPPLQACATRCGPNNPVVDCRGLIIDNQCFVVPICEDSPGGGIGFDPLDDILDP